MDYDLNVYYHPEKHNLKQIAHVDFGEQWQFDMHTVWQHDQTKKLYYAHDSGCSCPTPFEDFTDISELEPITKDNLRQFEESMLNLKESKSEILSFLNDVKIALDAAP